MLSFNLSIVTQGVKSQGFNIGGMFYIAVRPDIHPKSSISSSGIQMTDSRPDHTFKLGVTNLSKKMHFATFIFYNL